MKKIGILSCANFMNMGCPGTRVVKQGLMLAKQGVDVIHLAGCMVQEVLCPYFENDAVAGEIEKKANVPVVVGIE